MTVPVEVATQVRNRWPDRSEPWLAAVDGELAELCERYTAQPVRVFPARYSYAVAATSPQQGQLVFRGTPDPQGAHQAVVSCALAEHGVGPIIHESFGTQTGHWTVMNRVVPGVSLRPGDVPTAAVARMLSPLVGQPAPRWQLPYIGDWLRQRLEDPSLRDLAPGRQPAPGSERAHAIDVLGRLADTGERVLCHGDASPGNILVGQKSLWLIDPRGFSGEVAYDVAVVASKTSAHLESLAQVVGVSFERCRAWTIVVKTARV